MDEKKKEGAEAAPEVKKEEKKEGNKSLFIGLIAGVLVLNSVVAFALIQITSPKKEAVVETEKKADSSKVVEEKEHEVGATTGEEPVEVLVNIAGTGGERFLKVAVAFEYDDKAHPELGEDLKKMRPKIKDLLLEHLSKLTLIEVTEPDAKDKIRKDLLRLVNNYIPPAKGEVRDVYIVNYIIQ